MDYMKNRQSTDDNKDFPETISEEFQDSTQENILVNLNRYKVFSIDFSGNRIILETDLDIQKELQGNIFGFTMLSADNAFKSLQIPVRFKRRSSHENTTYVPIPPKFRSDCINKGLSARCYQRDGIIIFEITDQGLGISEPQYSIQQNL